MELSEFRIGEIFFCSGKRWRCTDIGTRIVAAICLAPHKVVTIETIDGQRSETRSLADDPSWFNGPPYAVVERVFDEYDLGGCSTKPEDGPVPAIVTEINMFDHIGFGVTDYAASKAFFLAALKPLGVTVAMEGPYGVGMGQDGKPSLWLHPADCKPAPIHLAFTAASRSKVDEFHRAAIAAGGRDNGAPGLRPHYHPNYYGAFVIGPDGHNVEAVCHRPEA